MCGVGVCRSFLYGYFYVTSCGVAYAVRKFRALAIFY